MRRSREAIIKESMEKTATIVAVDILYDIAQAYNTSVKEAYDKLQELGTTKLFDDTQLLFCLKDEPVKEAIRIFTTPLKN